MTFCTPDMVRFPTAFGLQLLLLHRFTRQASPSQVFGLPGARLAPFARRGRSRGRGVRRAAALREAPEGEAPAPGRPLRHRVLPSEARRAGEAVGPRERLGQKRTYRSSSGEVRRNKNPPQKKGKGAGVLTFFPVVYLRRGTLPQKRKGKRALQGDLGTTQIQPSWFPLWRTCGKGMWHFGGS